MGDSSETQSATLTALSDCISTIAANDLVYGLCVTNSGLFDVVPSTFDNGTSSVANFNTASTCRIMCTEQRARASDSCCAATLALQACNTSSSAVTSCKNLFDEVFTYQSECQRGLSSANAVLVTFVTLIVFAIVLIALLTRFAAHFTRPIATRVATMWTQATNLIWKNLVLRRRRPVSLVMELLLPLLLSTALVLLANLDKFTDTWRRNWYTSEAADLATNETLVCSELAARDLEDIGGPSSTMSSFYTGGQSILGLFFLISYIKFVSTTTTTMVMEKETRVREVMKIMGLADTTLLVSWCLTTAVLATPLAFAIAAELKYGNVFPTTEYATLVFLFWALSVAITAFAYFIAPFFNNSRSAAIASVLLWLILFFPYFAVQSASTNPPRYWAALSPPTAFALAVDEMLRRAQLGTGFAYSVGLMEDPVTVPSAFRMSLFLILDSFILVALGWYLEQVLPQQYGVTKPWHFVVTEQKWFRRNKQMPVNIRSTCDTLSPQAGGVYTQFTDDETVKQGEHVALVEPVTAALAMQERNGTCLELRNLRKVYDKDERVAVANVNLTIYSGQITALLGHNGAGKTTIVSMLTGLIPPTSGDATMYGYTIKRDFDELRKIIGICPQHDVLFQDLTVEEHLLLFGTMKQVPRKLLQSSVDKMINDVGLFDIRHALVKTLSGGQKRKLSVALAFVGGSKLVFLDEPTSGMDPYSRRFTWNLLQQSRQDRVIVLTTHFMDEADILGDRIAILADGQLRCVGSSLFLKNRFGAGYNLTMIKVLDGSCNPAAVEAFLRKYVPRVKCLSSSGSELVFQLPTASSNTFPTMLEQLDLQMQALGVQQYGISVTTLEEVFLRISHDHENERSFEQSNSANLDSFKPEAALGAVNRSSSVPMITTPSFWTQYRALSVKRFRIAKRDMKTVAYGVGIPLIFLVILAVLPEIDVANFIPNYASSLPTAAQQSQCDASTDFSSLVDPDFSVATCTSSQDFAYCSLGVLNCDVAVCCDVTNYASPWFPCNTCDSTLCYNSVCMEKDDAKLQVTLNGYLVALVVLLAFAFIPAAIVAYVVREKDPIQNAKSLQLISGANVSAYWMTNWSHDLLVTIIPIVAAAIIVPLTIFQSGADKASSTDTFAIIALLFAHVWAVIPLAYLFARRYVKHAVAQTALLVFSLGTGALLSMFSFLCRIVNFNISGSLSLSSLDRNYLRWIFMVFPAYALNNGMFELATRKVSRKALFGSDNYDTEQPSFFGLFEGLGKDECIECWDLTEPSCCVRQPFDLEIVGAPLLYTLVEAFVLTALVFILENRTVKWKQVVGKKEHSTVAMETEEKEDEDVLAERQRVERQDPRPNDLVFIRNLRQQYGDKPRAKIALKDLCLSIQSGECFGYLGINGAGKSTTMAVLTGQLAPTEGFVTLSGFDLSTSTALARKSMGYCPQFDALHDLLTVEEQLEFYARIKGISEAFVAPAVDDQIQELGLTKYRHSLTLGLSGGNKRKVSTAIALLGRPRVVFLDEPSTGVDPNSRRKMWDVIARVCSSERNAGACVVLTTHSMEECEALCSRVGILVSGRLKCLGSVEHIKQKFGKGYTVEITLRTLGLESEEVKRVMDDVHSFLRNQSDNSQVRSSSEGYQMDSGKITMAYVQNLCTALGKAERGSRILNHTGTGWLLGSQLESQGAIAIEAFALWWVLETCGENLCAFFHNKFPGTVLAEQQGEHFRFQVPKYPSDWEKMLRPAEIFRALEQTRSELNVDEYSVSETALEHIFNVMAAQQDEEKGIAHGMNIQEA